MVENLEVISFDIRKSCAKQRYRYKPEKLVTVGPEGC